MTSEMTVEQHMQRGDLEAALVLLATGSAAPRPIPGWC